MIVINIYHWLCCRSEKCQQMDPTYHQNRALRRHRRPLWGRWSTPFFVQVMSQSQSSTRAQNSDSNSTRVILTSSQPLHRISGQMDGHLPRQLGSTAGLDHLYMDLQTAAPLSLEWPAHLFHKQQRWDLSDEEKTKDYACCNTVSFVFSYQSSIIILECR